MLASMECKNFMSRKFSGVYRHYRLIYIIVASITILPLLILLYNTPSIQLWKPGLFSRVVGFACVTIGLVIMSISLRIYLSRLHSIRGHVTESSDSVLFQKGLHSHVRHPLYLGTFFLLWGILLMFPLGSILVTNIVITLYTLLGIRFEEKKLKAAFGDIYLRYMKEVPMIWPRMGKSKR
jgi:protein-S-isoprenylcysteine O-methyltransferase Ste14